MAAVRKRLAPSLANLSGSDTANAAMLAGAMIANNVIALGATVLFARLVDDYGSLGALVSYLLILSVAGQAMQVATAREGVLGHLGLGPALLATARSWTRTLMLFTAAVTLLSIILRQPIADAVGVKSWGWAAAVGIPAGCMYLEVCLLRGALQGIGRYKKVAISLVGEQASRLVIGVILAAAGLSVTGAYLGSLFSYIAMSAYCWWQLHTYAITVESSGADAPAPATAAIALWTHVKRAWAPILGLVVIAVLQNIDSDRRQASSSKRTIASSYAATAVAAKVLIWVAIGAGFYLVPEVSRRRAQGEETRPY